VGGLPEVVVDGETGLLVESGNPQAMFEAMMKLVSSPDLSGRLGRQARERALTRFTMKQCAEQFDEIYREIAS
jgi:glycosyltransferase involved in cell wall biosynthesis